MLDFTVVFSGVGYFLNQRWRFGVAVGDLGLMLRTDFIYFSLLVVGQGSIFI